MALDVFWANAALADLEFAAEYIARDSPRYAAVLVGEAKAAAASLDEFSKRGRIVPEINDSDIRELFVCNYRMIYQIEGQTVYVIGFIHGSRDLWALWKKQPNRKQ